MSAKQKRTYNLDPRTVRVVRELADAYRAAPTQDAVVELAVDELQRRLREAAEADVWAKAGRDREFLGEVTELEEAFATADRETWPG
jgi:hypothetical protein